MNKLYNIGSAPLREALNRVAQEGLVTYSYQHDFVVAPLSEDDLNDLLRTRNLLNDFALRESIAVGDVAWEEHLVLTHHRLRRTPFGQRAPTAEWEAAHREFHNDLLAGQEFIAEPVAEYSPLPGLWLGTQGYYYRQLTRDEQNGREFQDGHFGTAFAIGPEVRYATPFHGLQVTGKWQHEFGVRNRPDGERFWIQLFLHL